MSNPIGELVFSGNLLVALAVALLAGLISFASPCILPLVPGYLGYVGGFTGDTAADADPRRARRRLVLGVLLFVLGFTLVFVTFGVIFGVAGLLLNQWLDLIMRVAGVVLIVMGLVFI
ncbi:MAG TPA: cytochrome c biogenesis protein CcdA, partial [Terrimesophilobacter sp.]|nr:cytochrome c biogenesis protein CcdA [Terrimesophilobacter sp.]